MKCDIDLGCDHWLMFTSWNPDRTLNPQYADLPDVEHVGAIIYHPPVSGNSMSDVEGYCASHVFFDSKVTCQLWPEHSRWKVEKEDPLTLSPSVLCMRCGDHGFVRDGKWVRA